MLQAGEVVTCVFMNVKRGRIIVEKQTIPNGDSTKFTFSSTWPAGTFQLGDGEQNDSGFLAPGQYAVSESVPLGWDLTGLDCSSTDGREKLSLGLKAMRVLGIANPGGPAFEPGAEGGRVPA